VNLLEDVPLAPHTTMGVGGRARYFVEVQDESALLAALAWARERAVPVFVLGGGSNLLVADGGVDALVVKMASCGVTAREHADGVAVTAAAGDPWDDLVGHAVERGWAGLECLSGIPGLVGATPIQNVGAYGQDVSETITGVRALDTITGEIVTLAHRECAFRYRDSRFKSDEPGRHVVLAVTYRLRPGGAPTVRYAEVARFLDGRGVTQPSLADVRDAVLTIRRSKSMVIEAGDPNRRSCGSFFVNPIVSATDAARVASSAGDPTMPRWPEPDGRVKLSAAWLIEHAGLRRGHTEGPVGLSTRHALAIVAHDGASATDVASFARRVQQTVEAAFGIRLTPEPVFWGFSVD
jgi:UDP-N-acetylmuramate dehydrogenase